MNKLFVGLTFFILTAFLNAKTLAQDQALRINEFMALNLTTLTDKDWEYSDWIEIFNPTTGDINLSGWSLTDLKTNPNKWIFPQVIINANDYLILFASGKDIALPNQELHTNFKLSEEGEYFALIDPEGNIVSEFDHYPNQLPDVSFAYYNNNYIPTTIPTPGEENIFDTNYFLPPPVFSHKHGFYEAPFEIEITSELAGAQIYYTTDGSEPAVNNGSLYTSPVTINTTTALRAIVTLSGNMQSKAATATFLFLNDVINQPNNPPGYPSEWGQYVETPPAPGTAIADYEMDPEITQDPQYSNFIKDALLSLPVISIVTDKNNLFSHSTNPDSGGIYIYTGPPGNSGGTELGGGWERPASVEYFNSTNTNKFQIDCGLMIHGGHSRRPEKTPKHSFRLVFKEEYGQSKLNFPLFGNDAAAEFNTIVLRATYGNSWLHRAASERLHAQLIHDIWAKDTQLEMGNPSGQGIFVHLYINGLYWGIYNPTERIDNDYAESYFGGNEEDYDVIKDYGEAADGNLNTWNEMIAMANQGLANAVNYQRIQGKNPDGTYNPEYEPYLDIVNFIDYMIINFYGANWDWDSHNWVAVRSRVNPGKGFKFFSWDAEHILENVSSSVLNVNNSNRPSGLFQHLRENADFRRLFADRVQLHCFNSGALTPENNIIRWMKRADEIDLAVIAESARWGDYRRDVHPYFQSGPFDLYTKEHWMNEQSFLINNYFPNRTNRFIQQLREENLFPYVNAPQFFINGVPATEKIISIGDILTTTVSTGTIYYTTNGTDPVAPDGNVSPNAYTYTGQIELTGSTYIKARTKLGTDWSALNEKIFVLPADLNNLKLTEIHYHPLSEDAIDGENFEFIELKNTGSSPVDLSSVQFSEGISYSFTSGTILMPNEFIVLASNQNYFKMRYNINPSGNYDNQLDNAGERIILTNANSDTIINIRYNDKDPWPIIADGNGYSLVPTEINPTGIQNDPAKWRASLNIHGSPGKDDDGNTNIKEDYKALQFNFYLSQNYPNPFNPATIISYQLPVKGHVSLKVYDVLGNEVAALINEIKPAGEYTVNFDGSRLSSGVYFYRLIAGNDFWETKKMVLIR